MSDAARTESRKIIGSLRFNGDVDDFIARAGNVADDIFVEDLTITTGRMREDGVDEGDIQACRDRCRADWVEVKARNFAELRANLESGSLEPGFFDLEMEWSVCRVLFSR